MSTSAPRSKPQKKSAGSTAPHGLTLPHWALIGMALVLLAVLPFVQTWTHGFLTYDDGMYVTNNAWVQRGLSWDGLRWAFTTFDACNWHPLTWISHQLDCTLFGVHPHPHAGAQHLVNIALHAINTLLLWIVLSRMTGAVWRSALVAALFAVHPQHVESVAWISERKDLLSALFGFLTIMAYAEYARKGGLGRYLAMAVLFAAALLSKPMLVTLPCVLLLLDYWPLKRFGGSQTGPLALALEKVPLLAMAIASSIVTVIAQRSGEAVQTLQDISLSSRIANAAIACVMYLLKTIWPAGLAVFYPHSTELETWKVVGSLVVLVAITVMALRHRIRRPWLIVGWLIFLGMLVPVIGLVQVGFQSRADRYTYLPLIGVFIMIAWSIPEVHTQAAKVTAACTSIAAIAALSIVSFMQVGHWRSSVELFEHALAVTPDNHIVRCNLGNALLEAQQPDKAIEQLLVSVKLKDDVPLTHYDLGIAYQVTGQFDQALAHYRRAVELAPTYASAHANLGATLVSLGRYPEAVRECETALQHNPNLAEGHAQLGLALAASGQVDQAITHLQRAIELKPFSHRTRVNLAVCLSGAGRVDEGIKQLQIVLAAEPDMVEAHVAFSTLLAKRGDTSGAISHLQRAAALRPNDESIRQRLMRLQQPSPPPERTDG